MQVFRKVPYFRNCSNSILEILYTHIKFDFEADFQTAVIELHYAQININPAASCLKPERFNIYYLLRKIPIFFSKPFQLLMGIFRL